MLFFRHCGWAFLLLLAPGLVRAQVSYAGGAYTQNFDTLPASGTFALSGAGPFLLDAAPVNASGLTGWSFGKFAGTGANAVFAVSTGTSTAGAVYSYGTAAVDRALGSLGSGSVASRVGMTLVNSTGSTVTQFTLTYTGEQWRRGSAAANKLAFAYALGGTDLNTGAFVAHTALDFTAPIVTGSNAALDGNLPANRAAVSATVSGISWLPGQTLVLRWSDADDSGSDDGVAIDDLTFTTNVGPGAIVPAVTATVPSAGAVGVSPNATISVAFNTPVQVTGTWFTISGSTSGAHAATVSGGPASFVLSPTLAFAEGETVTVTLLAAQILDLATSTRNPSADAVFSFTTLSTAPVAIHTVQGAGPASPFAGQVVTIEGVVTGSFQNAGGLGGFYVQSLEANYDADPATSEGMFVFNNTFTVGAGELVRVTGTVLEFGPAPSTTTELTAVTSVLKLGTAPLPSAASVSLPFATLTAAERFEGMRVVLPQTLTVSDNEGLGQFGEVVLSVGRLSTPTNIVAPGAAAQAQAMANFLNSIVLDDAAGGSYPNPTPFLADSAGRGLTRRGGSTITGVTGILDEKSGFYRVEPTAPVTFTDANPRATPPIVGGSLRVAMGNVLNLFNGNGTGGGFPTARGADTLVEFQRQRTKIIAGIIEMAPDIIGLTEVENDGFGSTSAIVDLVNGLNAAAPSGTTYAFINAAGVDLGTDLITNALVYRVETVEPVGAPASLNNQYFAGIARPPLAQTFRQKATQEKLVVCVNHFKSKGSVASGAAATDGISPNPNLDKGDGQGASNYVRLREAQTLAQWLATDPTGSGDPDILIVGDLNAYAKEDPLAALEAAGYVNLTEKFEGVGGYSYMFEGEVGHLDHALATPHLVKQVVAAATWHANADEPVYYDYNLENKALVQQAINADTPYRYSDHDPILVGLNLQPDPVAPKITQSPESQTATVGDTVTFNVAASGVPAPTFAWRKDDQPIAGATATALVLNNITTSDAGAYTVVVTNAVGSVTSSPATLTVNKAVATVTLGGLSQTHDGLPKPVTVTTQPAGLNVVVTYDGAVAAPSAPGTYRVEAVVDDVNYRGGTSGTLTIRDIVAPVIRSLAPSQSVLPDNNHKMIPITIDVDVVDAADASPRVRIVSVTSNQPSNGKGDGNTDPDWEITGLLSVNLLAERSGNQGDRVYTIVVEARDAAGNATTGEVHVTVPHDR